MPLAQSITFKTEHFDYVSELPAASNAGNRFYGRDVAEFLSERLRAAGLKAEFLDEDWGWLVLGSAEDPATELEIATYNLSEHGEGGRTGAPEWGLWIRAFQRRKTWWVLSRRAQVPVPAVVLDVVLEAIRSIGAAPADWQPAPGG